MACIQLFVNGFWTIDDVRCRSAPLSNGTWVGTMFLLLLHFVKVRREQRQSLWIYYLCTWLGVYLLGRKVVEYNVYSSWAIKILNVGSKGVVILIVVRWVVNTVNKFGSELYIDCEGEPTFCTCRKQCFGWGKGLPSVWWCWAFQYPTFVFKKLIGQPINDDVLTMPIHCIHANHCLHFSCW